MNAGIDKKMYKTEMSNTRRWVVSMEKAGAGSRMTKGDLNSACKHFKVCPEDYELQVFTFG